MKIIVPLFFLLIAVLGCVTDPGRRQRSTSESERGKTLSGNQLKLLALNGVREYGFVTVQGQVSNITSERLENVEAIVSHYNAEGTFVSSNSALIEYNPLMPGQTSPFRVGTRYNPEMKTFRVEFKHLMGGTIEYEDATPDEKPKKRKNK